ncbi:DUF4244 domain-containing protein [Mycetocola reblochoni]|uniref:DUF4244 domain-containing protein n=1 Tax=Mycetocola reblochoni TaxID=331618 RepID=UPI003F9B467F
MFRRRNRRAIQVRYFHDTAAAVGFAGLLVVIMKSAEVKGFLLDLVRTALEVPM